MNVPETPTVIPVVELFIDSAWEHWTALRKAIWALEDLVEAGQPTALAVQTVTALIGASDEVA